MDTRDDRAPGSVRERNSRTFRDILRDPIWGWIWPAISVLVAVLLAVPDLRSSPVVLIAGSAIIVLLVAVGFYSTATLQRAVRHPWIAFGAAVAALFVLAAPVIVTAVPSALPRYEATNLLALALPFVPWFAAVVQSARTRRWGWLASALVVGAGAYIAIALYSGAGGVLVVPYLLPAITAFVFGVAGPRNRPASA
jgi:hypothetical protein